eukprot:1180383-Prorocentrum_minimum.AAC.1
MKKIRNAPFLSSVLFKVARSVAPAGAASAALRPPLIGRKCRQPSLSHLLVLPLRRLRRSFHHPPVVHLPFPTLFATHIQRTPIRPPLIRNHPGGHRDPSQESPAVPRQHPVPPPEPRRPRHLSGPLTGQPLIGQRLTGLRRRQLLRAEADPHRLELTRIDRRQVVGLTRQLTRIDRCQVVR